TRYFIFVEKLQRKMGQDVYSSYREYIRLHENTSCQGKPRHPKRAKWRVIAMAKNKRSGSEVRQRTKVITLRVNNRLASEIRRRAKNEGLTISEYIRTASLNNEIKQRVPSRYLYELIRLGRMQKKLFDKGKRPKDKEYLEVMHKIILLCDEMKIVTKRISDVDNEMDLIKDEIKIIKRIHKDKYPGSDLFK
ncbi:hypothetical protein OFM95_24240, partial [Escherichia coli]|nr:hypothetical protein [Escherichia coli]